VPETATKIAADTTVGAVELTVASLDRSIDYYTSSIGLQVLSRDGAVARLVAGSEEVLVLHEQPGAQPVQGHTGLFHFAILLPDRNALARWLVHAARTRLPLSGMSDHLVSEAIYLRDPDGHGIEIYRDRPRSEWPGDGHGGVQMATLPLDTDDLIGVLDDPNSEPEYGGMPNGTTMGHVHLHVADIADTERFYRDVMGFDVMAHMPDATFMSAGGYHHHLGANVWAGRGASPPPAGSAALRRAKIILPDTAERDRVAGRIADAGQDPQQVDGGVLVRDPAQNGLLLTTAG
jgi:catechol 2,3-dioxygenase